MGLLGLGLGLGNGVLLYAAGALILCRIAYAVYRNKYQGKGKSGGK